MPKDTLKLSDKAFDLFLGSEQDKKRILEMHKAYLDANTKNLDLNLLRKIWSANPACVWFNGTGYNYYGLDDWAKLWDYFRTRVEIVDPWQSTDVRLIGDGNMAVVTSERSATGKWIGSGEAPEWTKGRWHSRSTEVFMRENGEWKCVHVHISTKHDGLRHEQRG